MKRSSHGDSFCCIQVVGVIPDPQSLWSSYRSALNGIFLLKAPSSKLTFLQRCPGRWRRSQPPSGCSRSRQPPPWWWWSLQCWWCRDQPDHVEQIFDRSLTTTITQLASEFANLVDRNYNLLFLLLELCSPFWREQPQCQTQRFLSLFCCNIVINYYWCSQFFQVQPRCQTPTSQLQYPGCFPCLWSTNLRCWIKILTKIFSLRHFPRLVTNDNKYKRKNLL